MKHILKTESIPKFWRMGNVTIEGKVTVFNALAISEIIHLAFLISISGTAIKLLSKIQKEFILR